MVKYLWSKYLYLLLLPLPTSLEHKDLFVLHPLCSSMSSGLFVCISYVMFYRKHSPTHHYVTTQSELIQWGIFRETNSCTALVSGNSDRCHSHNCHANICKLTKTKTPYLTAHFETNKALNAASRSATAWLDRHIANYGSL